MAAIYTMLQDNVLTGTIMPKIVQNNQNTVYFYVDGDISFNSYAMSAVFYTDKDPTPYEVVLSHLSNDTRYGGRCIVPAEVLAEKCKLFITVKGVNGDKVYSSTVLTCKVLAGTPSMVISDPTETVYAQLLSLTNEIQSRFNNIIENSTVDSDSELLDIRVGQDGKTYTTAGEAVREQFKNAQNSVNHYPFMIFHGSSPVQFDTVNKTVTVPTIRAIGKKGYTDIENTTLAFATNNGMNVVYFKDGALGICMTSKLADDMELLFAFNSVSINSFVGCSLPVSNYSVDGKTFFEYKHEAAKRYGMQGFLSTVGTPVAFDTKNRTVTINVEMRAQGEKQLPITPTEAITLDWDMSGAATNYVYIKNGQVICSVIAPTSDDIYLFAFFRGATYLEEFCGCTLPVNMYTVNGNAYKAEKVIKFTENRNTHMYIEKDTKIYGNGYEINFGTPLIGERKNNIVTVNYTPDTDSHFYKTFVSRTEDLLIESNRPYYNVTIWAFNGNKYEAIRLTPYLTVGSVKLNDNSFTYVNGVITINSANYTDFVLAGEQDFGIAVTGNANVEIHDLKILFARGNNALIKNGRVKFHNCEFGFSTTGNGLSVQNADCDTVGCKAYYNRNDGFNYHYTGHSNVIECEGYCNFDDGISHHEECTFEIHGGVWCKNGKGGIASPTYGAHGRISSAVCAGNYYGIYAEATEEASGDIYINSVLLKNNTKGIHCNNYHLVVTNSQFCGNGENTYIVGMGSIEVETVGSQALADYEEAIYAARDTVLANCAATLEEIEAKKNKELEEIGAAVESAAESALAIARINITGMNQNGDSVECRITYFDFHSNVENVYDRSSLADYLIERGYTTSDNPLPVNGFFVDQNYGVSSGVLGLYHDSASDCISIVCIDSNGISEQVLDDCTVTIE